MVLFTFYAIISETVWAASRQLHESRLLPAFLMKELNWLLSAASVQTKSTLERYVIKQSLIFGMKMRNSSRARQKTSSQSHNYIFPPSYRLHSKWAVLLLSLISHENISTSCCDTRVSCFELDFMLGSTNHLSPRLHSLSPFQLFIDRLKISH